MKPRTPEKATGRTNAGLLRAERLPSKRTRPAETKIRPSLVRVKNILVPIDFSKSSQKTLQYALAFAKQFDAQLTLVYVVEPPVFTDFEAASMIFDRRLASKNAKEKLTVLLMRQGEDATYIKQVKTLVGKPFQEVVRLASNLRSDLIIIATHGRTGLKHVFLGSTAEKVVRHATCPVLVLREK